MKIFGSVSFIVVFILCLFAVSLKAQKYRSTSSTVHFFSSAPMEDIEASNPDGQSAIDLSSGEIVFSIPIRSFTFAKSLMQEHFNENYMESDKFPKATFIGSVSDFDLTDNQWQEVKADGKMTIHGIEQEVSYEGKLLINDQTLEISAKFPIKLEDYKIKIPKVVFYNIAEIVDVTVTFTYEKIE